MIHISTDWSVAPILVRSKALGTMGSQQSRIDRAVELARAGATVIAGNTRAARRLRLEAEWQALRENRVCETADVLPFEAWVGRTWTDALLAGVVERALLKPNVAGALWREIVANSPEGRELLSHQAAAELAAQAWKLVYDYKLPHKRTLYTDTPESKAFRGWAEAFEEHCEREGWIDTACAVHRMAARAAHLPRLPKQLVVFGFDGFTPAQEDLWDALRGAGCELTVLTPEAAGTTEHARVVACADASAEVRTAAQWARKKLEENPAARIGVIVPGLAGLRETIANLFEAVLHPENRLLTGVSRPRAFEISLGRPLAEHPMVRTALRVLRLVTSSLPSDEFSALLRSPYLAAGMSEASGRALLDYDLRRKLRATVTLAQVTNPELERYFAGAPVLAKMLRELLKQAPKSGQKYTHTGWATEARRLLRVAGWLGDSDGEFALQSEEYQASQQWDRLLADFCALDQVLPARTAAELQREAERAANDATFAAENEAAPVQVVGPVAASGEGFDALWFCGLSDEAWPQRGHPNPFIPYALQKSAEVPHNSAEWNLREAERVTARLLQSADECVLSWPQREEDRELRASPLLAGFAAAGELQLSDGRGWDEVLDGATLEELEDEIAPPVKNEDLRIHRTNLLQWQSGCPFRAFAQVRLAADKPMETALGANAIERGNIVDTALKYVWEHLRESRNLDGGLPQPEVERAISDAIEHALQDEFPKGEESWLQRHREIERERLNKLVHEWLDLEKKRHPFDVVGSQVEIKIKLGELEVSGRADRIDRTVDGEYVVIDYKTGSKDLGPKLWELPRPQDSQLPIYAVAQRMQQREVAGVAFARVRAGDCKFKGIASKKEIFGGTRNDKKHSEFAETLAKWQPELEKIAAELLAGRAEVDPKNAPGTANSTCALCHLSSLCRVAELDLTGNDDGVESGDDE